jgi:hypothetical protein
MIVSKRVDVQLDRPLTAHGYSAVFGLKCGVDAWITTALHQDQGNYFIILKAEDLSGLS